MKVSEFSEFYVSRIEDGYIRYEGPYSFEEAKEKDKEYAEKGDDVTSAIEALHDGELYIYDYMKDIFDKVYKERKVFSEPVDQKLPVIDRRNDDENERYSVRPERRAEDSGSSAGVDGSEDNREELPVREEPGVTDVVQGL